MQSKKERLINAIEGRGVDRTPVVCPGGMMNMITKDLQEIAGIYLPEAHSDPRLMADLCKAVVEEDCFENYGLPFCMTVEAENMGSVVDMGNQSYEPHVTKYQIDTVSDWEKIPELDLEKGRVKVVLDAIKLLKEESDDVPIIGNITGPVSFASSLMEPTIYYKEMRKKRDDMHAFMDFSTEQLIKFALAQIEAGADMIAISDPSGTGEILGPGPFKEYVVDYLNPIVDAIKEAGAYSVVHICGRMQSVYKEVNEVRADALSFDSMVNYREASENLPGRILMGNISTYTLQFGEPGTVEKLSNFASKHGSDILSPACGVGMDSPIENIQAILQQVKSKNATAVLEKAGERELVERKEVESKRQAEREIDSSKGGN